MVRRKKERNVLMTVVAIIILAIISLIFISEIGNKAYCGNGKCDTEEACNSCSQDCGPCPTTTTTVKITTTTLTTTTISITTTTVLPNVTTTKIPDSCSDSDGGVKYNVKGTVSGYYLGKPYSHTDFCTGDLLTEYFCSAYYGRKYYNCVYTGKKCIDGACV